MSVDRTQKQSHIKIIVVHVIVDAFGPSDSIDL